MIFYPHFTVTFRNEKEVGAVLTLADDGIFWQVKQSLQIVNQKVYDISISMKDWIALDRI